MLRIDDLQFQGLHIIQDTTAPRFSQDAVLLANFLRLNGKDCVVDLGTGNGIIAILGQAKTGAAFCGVEQDGAQCDLARRSAAMNGQDIPFYCMSVEQAPQMLGHGRFTAAVMNPPYFTEGDQPGHPARAAARPAEPTLLDAFLQAAFLLLNNGGKLFMVYPAEKLTDLVCALRAHRLEPKRLQPALSGPSGAPTRVLVEAKKLGHPGLIWEPGL